MKDFVLLIYLINSIVDLVNSDMDFTSYNIKPMEIIISSIIKLIKLIKNKR